MNAGRLGNGPDWGEGKRGQGADYDRCARDMRLSGLEWGAEEGGKVDPESVHVRLRRQPRGEIVYV